MRARSRFSRCPRVFLSLTGRWRAVRPGEAGVDFDEWSDAISHVTGYKPC